MEKDIISAITPGGPLAKLFPEQASWTAWHIFLKALYGRPMSEGELEIFTACTGRKKPPEGGAAEAWCCVGRRGGKSRTAATVALFEAVLGGWEKHRAPGEEVWVQILACDKQQASIILGYVRAGLELFPDLIKSQTVEEIHLNNGIGIGVKAASLRGTRGYTTCCLICDEAAFWRDSETSANPMDEILAAIMPGLLPGGKTIVISTPYARFGTFYETYKEYFAQDDSDILVWQAASDVMNPTLHEPMLKRLMIRLKLMRSEFDATFREDISNLFPEHVIEGAMNKESCPPDPKLPYVAFLDPSGGASDSFAMAIALHTSEGQINVCRVEERTPPFDPTQVVKEYSDIFRQYGVRRATSDRYGGIWPVDAFKKCGIMVESSELTASEIYLEAAALMNSGRVHLPRHDDRLKVQLQLLERRTSPGGRDRVDHPPGGHDDRANAVCGAIELAARNRAWTLAEQEARMPRVSEHRADPFMTPSLAAGRKREEIRRSAEAEMRDFMVGSGCNEIVKPGMRGRWTPPRERKVGEVVTVARAGK